MKFASSLHQFNLLSVDGETDRRDSLLTNSMQTSWSVDGETDCREFTDKLDAIYGEEGVKSPVNHRN